MPLDDWLRALTSVNEETILSNKRAGLIYVANFANNTGKYISAVFDSPEEEYDVGIKISPRVEVRITYVAEGDAIKGVQLTKLSGTRREVLNFSTFQFESILGLLKIFSGLDLTAVTNKSLVLDESIVGDAAALKQALSTILRDPQGVKVLTEVADAAGIIMDGDVQSVASKRSSLQLFHELLNSPERLSEKKQEWGKTRDEDAWQYFFEQNKWIFGYGLEYVFNCPVGKEKLQQVLAGSSVITAGKRPDGLVKSFGAINFLNIVEIKKPDTMLLNNRQYRTSRVWSMSDELCGAIAQCQQYIRISKNEWSEVQQMITSDGTRTGEEIFNFHPKCFLVIGSLDKEFLSDTGSVANPDQLSCFEDIRANTSTPQIITFDELYHRAANIVEFVAAPAQPTEQG